MNEMKRRVLFLLILVGAFGMVRSAVTTIAGNDVVKKIMPPEGAEIEIWDFLSTTYGVNPMTAYADTIEKQINVVVDGNDIYLQGLVNWATAGDNPSTYNVPEAWILAEDKGDFLDIKNGELSCIFKGIDAYVTPSTYTGETNSGNTYSSQTLSSIAPKESLKLLKKESGSNVYESEANKGISITKELNGNRGYTSAWYDGNQGSHFPSGDFGFYPNIRLTRGTSSVTAITADRDNDDPHYYDLTGRAYAERPMVPGLYIHKGKKMMVGR